MSEEQRMALSTRGLSRSFGALKAVNDISIDIPEGKIWAVIGSNGAGKSTLLDLITNRTSPSSGKVYYCGEEITGLATHRIVRKGIGKCFQVSKLFGKLTVYENVQIACICNARRHFRLFDDARGYLDGEVRDILRTIALEGKEGEAAGVLSYGDQRKLEIGVTLALNPKLLMLDEPTAGISRTEGYELMAMILQIVKQRGITVVFIEHDMDIVFDFAERITVMHRGEHLFTGTPEEVRNNPKVISTYLGEM